MGRPVRKHRLDKGMMAWIERTARKHHWRVASWIDLDDLIQEGYVCYALCNQRYPRELGRAHIMALTKTTFHNRIHDLAKQRTRLLEEPLSVHAASEQTPEEALENALPAEHETQTFATLVLQLPAEIRELLTILLNDAASIGMRKERGRRESLNTYLWRLIGQKPCGIDLQCALANHFGVSI